MANKKQQKSKRDLFKTVDLTANKTSAFVRNSNMNVERTFHTIMKNSHIPVFISLAKETTLGRYFMNRKLYEKIVGPQIVIMDYFMRIAIAKEAARLCMDILNGTKYTYPGYWDNEVMLACLVRTNLIPDTDDVDTWYLTTRTGLTSISAGEVAELHAAGNYTTVMKFTEYNPNRLYQLIQNIYFGSLATIISEINRHYPKAYASTEKMPTAVRMATELGIFTKNNISDNIAAEDINGSATDASVNTFIKLVEKDLLVYLVELLKSAGINEKLINEMFGKMELHALYDIKNVHSLGQANITYIISIPTVTVDSKPVTTTFQFTISELYLLAMNAINAEKYPISASKAKAFGNRIDKLMNDLILIATTIAIQDMNESDLGASENQV